jgi:hypothetical protein
MWRSFLHEPCSEHSATDGESGYISNTPRWDQDLCVPFDASSPISSSGIDKVKHLYHYLYPHYIPNIYYSSSKWPMAQSRSYSYHKKLMPKLSEMSQSSSSNSSRPLMKITVIHSGNCLQQVVIDIQKWGILIAFTSRDYISLQETCQIFLDQFACLRSPISRSLGCDVYRHLISLTCHTVLLTIIFISLRSILIPLTYGHSKFAIQLFQCDSIYPL